MKPEKTDASIAYAASIVGAIADNYTLAYSDPLGDVKLFRDRLFASTKRFEHAADLPPCINLAIADVMDDTSPTPFIERVIRLDYLLRQYLGTF